MKVAFDLFFSKCKKKKEKKKKKAVTENENESWMLKLNMFQSLLDSNCAKVFEFALSNENRSIKIY